MKRTETIENFARMIYDLLKSDRDVVFAIAGFTGEGKSTFATILQKVYSEISQTEWSFDRMTWDRKELLKWINGEEGSKKDPETGLNEGQLPEYSAILPDELFPMFYRRNWYKDDQIEAVSVLNMCRDRHLFIVGNVPDFWDLDGGFQKRVRFYAYIPERGRAWLFQQENNPFSPDPWNVNENRKKFRRAGVPYNCPNFICEINFPDWEPAEKKKYYEIRNVKRVAASKQNKKVKFDSWADIKAQRQAVVELLFNRDRVIQKELEKIEDEKIKVRIKNVFPSLTFKFVAEIIGVHDSTVREWLGRVDKKKGRGGYY